MQINKQLTVEEVKLLQGWRVVLDDQKGRAHFEKKEPVPLGMKRLPDGKLIPWTPIQELVNKW